MGLTERLFPERLRVGPLRQGAFTSALHSERTAAWLGLSLGVAFGLCFATGLLSHAIQHPPAWFEWPARPAWAYRATQGVHVAAGLAAIQLLPSLHFILGYSTRTRVDFAQAGAGFPFAEVAQFLITGLVSYWHPLYVGLLPLGLARIRFWFWLAHEPVSVPVVDTGMRCLYAFAPLDDDLAQETEGRELMQRVVDGGERHWDLRLGRFLVEHLGGQVPVAFGEQDPAERHALAGRAKTDIAQHRLHVVPRAAVQSVPAEVRGNRRHIGRAQDRGTRFSHFSRPELDQNHSKIVTFAIISVPPL